MPPSQLRKLKQTLRDQGLVGPQQSSKSSRKAKNGQISKQVQDSRATRLQNVRDQFNPFELKTSDAPKFTVAGNNAQQKTSIHRPGATKSLGEEKRRNTLFVEMQRRRKTGGITDRRFGENDPQMTPEQKSLQRYVRERERASRKSSMFDLEDPMDDGFLTHLGETLPLGANGEEIDMVGGGFGRGLKRRRLSPSESCSDQENGIQYDANAEPKSRKEAMEEVIARSKLQKYERQKEKEDDDDLRAELDKGLSDVFSALRQNLRGEQATASKTPSKSVAPVNPDRQALIEGKDRHQADKEYDERLRQMAIDQRARPAMPTLTEEEKVQRQAQKVKELEVERLRRMWGDLEEQASEGENIDDDQLKDAEAEEEPDSAFGLGSGLLTKQSSEDLGVEDEDDFVIDDDVLTDYSGSESELSQSDRAQNSDDDGLQDSLSGLNFDDEEAISSTTKQTTQNGFPGSSTLGHSGCPDDLDGFLKLTKDVDPDQIPLIVQRLRALYHPRLDAQNKVKLASFSVVLIEYIYYATTRPQGFSSTSVEALIRHIHSLAKMFPTEVGDAFRSHLRNISEQRPDKLDTGDLIILTAIGSIFPTSDHFHPVVTPAMLCMTRYLSQSTPSDICDLAKGTFVSTICLQYQMLAQRYIPEVLNYVRQALDALLPTDTGLPQHQYPHHTMPVSLRLNVATIGDANIPSNSFPLSFTSISSPPPSGPATETLKAGLLTAQLRLLDVMIDTYASKSSFYEIFAPTHRVLVAAFTQDAAASPPSPPPAAAETPPGGGAGFRAIKDKARELASKLDARLQESLERRKPLTLHHHRPLPIKTSLPKFDESFNPDKHNDPDADRAELSKLKAQHKKERKGALRELRKDARFVAREDLRERKEKDAAYEKKFKRLVAEIQGEEGHESKVYEKEKRKRLGKK